MACVNPDGSLTPAARKVLEIARQPVDAKDIVQQSGLPLFRVRGSLRELIESQLLEEIEGSFQITSQGLEKLN